MPYRQNFPIPAVIDPPKQCLCIEIPNHPDWKAVIAGLLSELRYWYNWERTGDMSGAECAAVWKVVFDSIDWSDMSCCCDQIPAQFRFTADGVMEMSTDGGVTWDPSPDFDPRLNSTRFPPVAGSDGDDKKCVAATGMVSLIKGQVGDNLTDDMGRYTLLQLVTDWVNTLIQTSNPFQALLTIAANQIFALVISVLRAALTDTVYDTLLCIFYCRIGADASFTDAQVEAVRSDIGDQIGGVASLFLQQLIFLLGSVGMTNLARSGGATSGDCSECPDCTCAGATGFTSTYCTVVGWDEDTCIVTIDSGINPASPTQSWIGFSFGTGNCATVEIIDSTVPLYCTSWLACGSGSESTCGLYGTQSCTYFYVLQHDSTPFRARFRITV